jgi:hypothetical protein
MIYSPSNDETMAQPKPAKGVEESGRIKIAIAMPPALFYKIRARAQANGVSFSREAVELLSCGLFDYEESEEAEEVNHAKPQP